MVCYYLWFNFPAALHGHGCIVCNHDNEAGPALRRSLFAAYAGVQKPLMPHRKCVHSQQKLPTNPWDSAFCVVCTDACQHIFWYIWGGGVQLQKKKKKVDIFGV